MTLLFNRPILAKSYKVAKWLEATQLFDTPVTTLSLQSASIEAQYATDEAMIQGAMEHALAFLEGGEVKLNVLGWDIGILEVLTNMTHSLSGSGSTAKRTLTIPHSNHPYFGLIVQFEIDGGGDMHVGFIRCKAQNAFDIEVGEHAEFSIPEMTAKFLRLRRESDGVLFNAMRAEAHATAEDITTNFNTWFGLS